MTTHRPRHTHPHHVAVVDCDTAPPLPILRADASYLLEGEGGTYAVCNQCHLPPAPPLPHLAEAHSNLMS